MYKRNQVGPVGSAVAGMAALLVAWGCDPQPPEACGTVQDQTVNVYQTVRVTPCFTDPDGDELVLSAESSDPAVADVSVTGAAVSVRGAGVGGAAVVVTAKDHHGLQARTRFGVAVPNRAPELTKAFDTLTAEIGRSRYVALGKHFTDPDGHAMSYGIGSVDSSAVAAVVENSRLHISGRAEGQTEVTVIASDGRDSSEATVRVRVPEPVRSFRDDFDSEESLADWTRVRAGASVEDGRLHVSPDTMDEGYAHRYAGEAPAAARWRIKVSMASADSAGVAGVRWQAKGGSHRAYFFSVGGGTARCRQRQLGVRRLLPVRSVHDVRRLGGPVRMERRHRGGRSPGVPHLDGGRPRIRPHRGGRPVAGAWREAGLRQVGDNIHRAPRTLRAGRLQPGCEGPRSRLRLGGARRQMTPASPDRPQ